jgi:hypothetical protein
MTITNSVSVRHECDPRDASKNVLESFQVLLAHVPFQWQAILLGDPGLFCSFPYQAIDTANVRIPPDPRRKAIVPLDFAEYAVLEPVEVDAIQMEFLDVRLAVSPVDFLS